MMSKRVALVQKGGADMRKPFNLRLLNRHLGRFIWLSACGFGMGLGLIGCETFNQQSQPVESASIEQSPPIERSPPLLQPIPSCSDLDANEFEKQAIALLDRGEPEIARTQLECALKLNPDSDRAKILIEQLDADPVEYLGRPNYLYKVKSNDTLSKIARKRLGSSLKFYILARYNDIDIPANLAAGQTIKIPGQKPPPAAPPPPEPSPADTATTANDYRVQALSNEESGNIEAAFELINKAKNSGEPLENIEEDYSRIKQTLILQLEEKAYNQELSESPEQALESWNKVLQIDPGNIQAQLSINRLSQ
jgi:tetratricopeptide (TPR) repeat protein